MDLVSLIIKIVLCLFSLFLVIVVLLQSGSGASEGAFGGAAVSAFAGKSKARGLDAILTKLTKISAIGLMVLAVALVLINRFA